MTRLVIGPETRAAFRGGARLPGSLSQALVRISICEAEILWGGRVVAVAKWDDHGPLEDGDVLEVGLAGSGSTIRLCPPEEEEVLPPLTLPPLGSAPPEPPAAPRAQAGLAAKGRTGL